MLSLFFGIQHTGLQIATTCLVTLLLCLNVLLLAACDDPFTGEVCVRPGDFEVDRQSFRAILDRSWK